MLIYDYLKEKAANVARFSVLLLLSFGFSSVAPVRAALGLGAVGGRGLRKVATLHDAYQTSGVIGDLCRSLLFM